MNTDIRVRLLACIGLLAAPLVHATEPLHDLVVIDGRMATLSPPECCWVKLPESAQLQALRMQEFKSRCSAIGGPVGTFELRDQQLFLRELRTCSGDIPLVDVFPNLRAPALATWLTGKYVAYSGYLCSDKESHAVPEIEIAMTVVAGKVVATDEKRHTKAECST